MPGFCDCCLGAPVPPRLEEIRVDPGEAAEKPHEEVIKAGLVSPPAQIILEPKKEAPKEEPAAAAAPAAPAAAPAAGAAEGLGYLIYQQSEKQYVLCYSKEDVPDSLLTFKPTKPIPDHKFSTNSGRNVLVKASLGDRVGSMAPRATVAYVRAAYQYGGVVEIMPAMIRSPDPFTVCFHEKGDKLTILDNPGESFDCSVPGVQAVGCFMRSKRPFAGLLKVTLSSFVDRIINEQGAAVTLDSGKAAAA